jgi:hypothetical protein
MSNNTIPVRFKEILLKFIGQLSEIYPGDLDLHLSNHFVKFIPVDELIKGYTTFVLPHIELANKRDVKFFEEAKNNKFASKFYGKFQDRWKDMPEENRTITWDFIECLNKLALKYAA